MNDKLKIAVFVDYDNIEIGLKTTLQRELEMSVVLDTLKERGDIVAKFAYADWGRQEGAKRQMAESAVQMVQRVPSPRGDKNGADINLALDALEMAFTHGHINAFAIVSGDSDFIPLVNKLKEYGKTIFVVGGRAFTSTILQKNCHEFISFETLLDESPRAQQRPPRQQQAPKEQVQGQPAPQDSQGQPGQTGPKEQGPQRGQRQQHPRVRPQPLDLQQAWPLVERALQVLERREVTPQLGLLKSTMLQLDATFSEKAYGCGSFTDFVEKLRAADYVNVTGGEGRYVIDRKTAPKQEEHQPRPEEALPILRDLLETHRLELDNGALADDVAAWIQAEHPDFAPSKFGFQEFAELLNFAQDKLLVRIEPDEEKGLMVSLGAEFYPPAPPEPPPEPAIIEDEKQPESNESPALIQPPVKKRRVSRPKAAATKTTAKRPARTAQSTTARRPPRKKPVTS
jgi:uncharacterized protein (TIGR00288 family)